jgi:hypothetical protein
VDSSDNEQGFVVNQRKGRWGTAIEVPGLGALNVGQGNIGDAVVTSVSCASAGNCAAGGYYDDSTLGQQGFVAAERDGVWGTAIKVPGLGALNKGGAAAVVAVSCASAGTCAAGGDYTDGSGHSQGFVAAERHGLSRPDPPRPAAKAAARHMRRPSARQFTRTRQAHPATLTASNPASRPITAICRHPSRRA